MFTIQNPLSPSFSGQLKYNLLAGGWKYLNLTSPSKWFLSLDKYGDTAWSQDKRAKFATPKYATLAYWLLWIKVSWETVHAKRTLSPSSLSPWKQEVKKSQVKVTLSAPGGKEIPLSSDTGNSGPRKQCKLGLVSSLISTQA